MDALMHIIVSNHGHYDDNWKHLSFQLHTREEVECNGKTEEDVENYRAK